MMNMATEFDEREMAMISNAGFRNLEMKSATVTVDFFDHQISLHCHNPANAITT